MKKEDIDRNKKILQENGFPYGLIEVILSNANDIPLRYFLVDDSASMKIPDGNRASFRVDKTFQFKRSSRWEELKTCVEFHSKMTSFLGVPTKFRFLNGDEEENLTEFSVCEHSSSSANTSQEIIKIQEYLNKTVPHGHTPMTSHINDIEKIVRDMVPMLNETGKTVPVIIATDGLPSDNKGIQNDDIRKEFVAALNRLMQHPVYIVVRLCTGDDKVINFYDKMDLQNGSKFKVLDDFKAEYNQICEVNPWFNYPLIFHRFRESGLLIKMFDEIDQRPLTKGELMPFFKFLFGDKHMNTIVDPEEDWRGFLQSMKVVIANESVLYHSWKKKRLPWIDLRALNKAYGESNCLMM